VTAYTAFWIVFPSTVALLGVDLFTGLTGRRRLHLASVALTVTGLVASIVLAVRMGSGSSFDPRVQLVHRALARSVVVLLLPMAVTGAMILSSGRAAARRAHRRVAYVLVALALAATATGVAMKRTARPADDLANAADMLKIAEEP
jgi:hypothetical protein